MKITDLSPRSAQFVVKHPLTDEPAVTDDNKPVVIEVIGVDSPEFFDYQQSLHKKMRDAHVESGKLAATDISPELMEELMVDSLVVCVLGWPEEANPFFAPLDTKRGKGKFSEKLVRKLISDPRTLWFRQQLELYINSRANFFAQ
jgi:hypothetical protein